VLSGTLFLFYIFLQLSEINMLITLIGFTMVFFFQLQIVL